jgi:hypothetical protein
MRIHTTWTLFRFAACILLLLSAGNIAAQSADQAIKTLPQSIKDNGENHVVTKSNTVSNNAMNKLDSASNKAFKGFTGMFKKKNKKSAADSTKLRNADSTRPHATTTTTAPDGVPSQNITFGQFTLSQNSTEMTLYFDETVKQK